MRIGAKQPFSRDSNDKDLSGYMYENDSLLHPRDFTDTPSSHYVFQALSQLEFAS